VPADAASRLPAAGGVPGQDRIPQVEGLDQVGEVVSVVVHVVAVPRLALRLHALTGDQAREDAAGGSRLRAGRIADAFYIDLSLLAIVNGAVAKGTAPDLAQWRPGNAKNSFAGTTVESIVLEVPHAHPRLRPGARAGTWCATKLATDAGGWRQINRAGYPMMGPIFWPGDTDFSNPANTRHPSQDFAAAGKYIGEQAAAVVAASGTAEDPRRLLGGGERGAPPGNEPPGSERSGRPRVADQQGHPAHGGAAPGLVSCGRRVTAPP
jgi:hypothetical protein